MPESVRLLWWKWEGYDSCRVQSDNKINTFKFQDFSGKYFAKNYILTGQSRLWNQETSLQEDEGRAAISQYQTTAVPLPKKIK